MCDDGCYEEPLKDRVVKWLKNALNYTSFGGDKREFSEFEYKLIRHIFNCFAEYEPKIASWLFEYIDVNKVKFVWNSSIHNSGIMGSFTPLHPNTITVSDLYRKEIMISRGYEWENEDLSKLMIIFPNSDDGTVKVRHNSLNTATCCLMLMNFPTIIHEMTHMFQFGIPCRFVEGMTLWDKFLLKVVQPIGYVFNRLVTVFIDNPLIDTICTKIYEMFHPNDIGFNRDNVHLPFFYKFTLEYDVDKMIEDSERLKEFSEKMQQAMNGREFEERESPDNPEKKHTYDSYSEEDKKHMRENYDRTIKSYREECGERFWKWAGELYEMHKHERERIIKKFGL